MMKRKATTGLAQISNEVRDLHPVLLRLLPSLPDVAGVEYTHGVNEMGADFIVTVKEHTLGETEYVAIVAKIEDINQQNFENVARQVNECFIPKLVAGGKQQVQVDEVWVVTTGVVTHNAKLKFNSQLRDKKVKFLGGEKINHLIERFCPQLWVGLALEAQGQMVELLHAVMRSSQALVVLTSQIQKLADGDVPKRIDLLRKYAGDAESCARALAFELHNASYRIRPETHQHKQPVHFFQALTEVLKAVRPVATHRKIEISISDSIREMPTLLCDEHLLRIILYNILSAAVRFSFQDSAVDLRCKSTKSHHQVMFSNRGLPIRDRDKVLSSPDAILVDPAGLGMGLFIARTLSNQMGFSFEQAATRNASENTFILEIPKGSAR